MEVKKLGFSESNNNAYLEDTGNPENVTQSHKPNTNISFCEKFKKLSSSIFQKVRLPQTLKRLRKHNVKEALDRVRTNVHKHIKSDLSTLEEGVGKLTAHLNNRETLTFSLSKKRKMKETAKEKLGNQRNLEGKIGDPTSTFEDKEAALKEHIKTYGESDFTDLQKRIIEKQQELEKTINSQDSTLEWKEKKLDIFKNNYGESAFTKQMQQELLRQKIPEITTSQQEPQQQQSTPAAVTPQNATSAQAVNANNTPVSTGQAQSATQQPSVTPQVNFEPQTEKLEQPGEISAKTANGPIELQTKPKEQEIAEQQKILDIVKSSKKDIFVKEDAIEAYEKTHGKSEFVDQLWQELEDQIDQENAKFLIKHIKSESLRGLVISGDLDEKTVTDAAKNKYLNYDEKMKVLEALTGSFLTANDDELFVHENIARMIIDETVKNERLDYKGKMDALKAWASTTLMDDEDISFCKENIRSFIEEAVKNKRLKHDEKMEILEAWATTITFRNKDDISFYEKNIRSFIEDGLKDGKVYYLRKNPDGKEPMIDTLKGSKYFNTEDDVTSFWKEINTLIRAFDATRKK